MKKSLWAAAAFASVAISATAFAHSGATGVVKERMDAMIAMGDVVKDLSAMMRGETPYDADAVRAGAAVIESHSGEALTELFPEDSAEGPSETRPEVWTDWETFVDLSDKLGTYAEGLRLAADNGLGAAGPAGGSSMMGTGSSMMGTGSSMMGTGSSMMGTGSSMMGTAPEAAMTADQLAEMPADGVFMMVSQVCSACHTKFRREEN